MNARILRKWSIHTKNLMSCSACSLVVVVLLLLPLLLVTCAPTLALATMNPYPTATHTTTSLSPSQSSLSMANAALLPSASGAALVVAGEKKQQQPMPKNIHHAVVVAGEREGEETRQTYMRPTTTTSLPSLPMTTIFASIPATSLSYQQQPTKLLATSSQPYRRSYSSNSNRHQASQRVEVANNGGDIMARESFPGFYTQTRRNRPDDIQPTWPLLPQHASGSSSSSNSRGSSSSGGGLLAPDWLHTNKDILNTHTNTNNNNNNKNAGWPKTSSNPLESFNDHDEVITVDIGVDANNDYEDIVDEDEEEDDNDFDGVQDNDDIDDDDEDEDDTTLLTDNKYHQDNKATRLNTRDIKRRLEDRRHTYRQHYYQQQQQQQQYADNPPSHPPKVIEENNVRIASTQLRPTTTTTTIFSSPNHKSLNTMIVGGPPPATATSADKVFDISNILKVNKIKSSAAKAPIRFVIESYEVAPLSPSSITGGQQQQQRSAKQTPMPRHLKQLRSRHAEQQQAARNRRNKRNKQDMSSHTSFSSSASSPSTSSSSSLYFRHQHHHNHNNNLRNQRLRNKHGRRYCSARDPAQLAFEAPTVFEGKIVSMTPDRRMNFSATVEVREVFKQQIGYRLQKYLRLQFAYRNSSGECDIYREQLRPRGLVKGDTIEPGRIYLLFVQQIDIGNFTILGQPIRKTKRVVEAVRNAVSENYAQLASIRSISASNRTVENGQELRIVCKVTGRPPPKVTWFKDHRSINRNRKLYQFIHYKKRSELIIRSFNTSDAGRYECRAKNKVNRNIERRTIVIKAYPVVQRFDPNPRGAGNTCPDDASEFCFNGGTCKFFSEISSYSCICPEGFIGERCDRKEVNNPNFMLQSTAKYTPLII
ncbi:membrane-bound neuregulin protein vein isoform X2 [Musca autumnalis]|uniref:membrane-bound neuregulin protein vein isoform X2 n=1 Tax=Musca autumnalis TaxID=221902 RepID=UPI003CF0FC56